MATITNKTSRPLNVPLPGGKKLHLGPLKSGEIAPKAIDHPAVQRLVEAGDVEIDTTAARGRAAADGGKAAPAATGGPGHAGVIRRTGER